MANVDVPKAQHLVALDLDLRLAVACGDRCSILLLLWLLLLHGILLTRTGRTPFLLQLSAVEVLCVRRGLALTDRFCRLFLVLSAAVLS